MGRKKTTQDRFNDPFPTRFRELSDNSGLNQAQIGEAVGKIRQTISDYQNGISMPDVETVVRLAELFGVTTDYLLGIPGSVPTLDTDLQAVCRYLHLSQETVKALAVDGALEFNTMPDRFLNTTLYREFISCLIHLESLSGKLREAVSKAENPESKLGSEWSEQEFLHFSDCHDTMSSLCQEIKAERFALWEAAEEVAAELTGCTAAEAAAREWQRKWADQSSEWLRKEV